MPGLEKHMRVRSTLFTQRNPARKRFCQECRPVRRFSGGRDSSEAYDSLPRPYLNFNRALLTRTDFALTDTENFGRTRRIAIKWQKPLPNELPRRRAAGYLQRHCNAASNGELTLVRRRIEFRQVVTGLQECDWD